MSMRLDEASSDWMRRTINTSLDEETKRKMAEARKRYWEKRRKNKDGLEAH